jgi:hypothetical protein
MATSLPPVPLAPVPSRSDALRVERSSAWPLLAYGLGLMLAVGGLPALALWQEAPEAARAIALWMAAVGGTFALVVIGMRRTWLSMAIAIDRDGLEVRRPHLRPERARFTEIRRMRYDRVGLTLWLESGRTVWVGRVGRELPRVVAWLESRSGVPVEGALPGMDLEPGPAQR